MDVDLGQSPTWIRRVLPTTAELTRRKPVFLVGLRPPESHLPLFLRLSTSPLETSPASMRASTHSCGRARPLRSMQFRSAALSNPYSLQYLRYASAQKFFSASVIFLGSALHKEVFQQTAKTARNPCRATLFSIRSLLQSRNSPHRVFAVGASSHLWLFGLAGVRQRAPPPFNRRLVVRCLFLLSSHGGIGLRGIRCR